jgi:hypothetical protein
METHMERSSDTHSPRIDEDLDRLTRSVTHGAPVESRIEEEREQEGPADDDPVPDAVLHDPAAREEIERRSELARHLEPSVFPCSRGDVLASARRQHAPDAVMRLLERLPDGEYQSIESVWEGLGGARERRR